MCLKDKVTIITGAAGGIGKEITITFAREGAKIVIADLNQKAADATVAELNPAGRRALGVVIGVTSEDQVNAGFDKAITKFGAPNVFEDDEIVALLVADEDRAGVLRRYGSPALSCPSIGNSGGYPMRSWLLALLGVI